MKQSRPPRQRPLSQRVFTVSGGYNPVLCGRSSSRRAHYKEWDEVQMGKAVEACVNEGMSIRQAAFHFGVPKSTLGDRMSGRVVPCSTSGPKTYLSPVEETELVKFLLRCAAIGDPKSHVTRNHGILDYLLSVRNNHIIVLIDNAQELAKVEFDMVRSVRHFINTSPRATCLAFSQDP